MNRRQFFLELLKRSWHGGWLWAHVSEVILAIVFGVLVLVPEFEHTYKFLLSIPFVLLVLALLLGPYWHAYSIYKEGGRSNEFEKAKQDLLDLQAQWNNVCDSCTQIFHLGDGEPSTVAFLSDEWILVIEKDGTLQASRHVTLRATQEPVDMIRETLLGDRPVDHKRLDFQAQVDGHREDGLRIAMLPAKDQPQEKDFLLFFLSAVTAANSPVSYTLKWKWPRAFEALVLGKEDSWKYLNQRVIPVPSMIFRFKLHPDLPPIRLSNVLQGGGKQVEPPKPTDERDYREYIWQMDPNVAPNCHIDLRLKKL